MRRESFGTLAAGKPVERLTIAAGELTAGILSFGAILQSLYLKGTGHSLTLGSGQLGDYEGPLQYHGPIVGPVANRIAGAQVTIAGQRHNLTANEGANTLHGGAGGTHNRLWEVVDHRPASLTLGLTLKDGEGGFPGNREITACFAIAPPAALTLTIETRSDAATFANLTNHSYWQLGPKPDATQSLTCPAETRVLLDREKLPTGDVALVENTPLDFRHGRDVGAGELDLCLCLAPQRRPLNHAAFLTGGELTMAVETTEPGLQIYDGAAPGGLAIEAQNWPGAAHHANFPTDLLRPGEVLTQITRWSFSR